MSYKLGLHVRSLGYEDGSWLRRLIVTSNPGAVVDYDARLRWCNTARMALVLSSLANV